MEEHSLENIRHDSIRKIFGCITAAEQVSRLEISNDTGLSLMSVGKITDMLAEKGVIVYAKSDNNCVGRKAKKISLADGLYELVIELKADVITAVFLDLCLCESRSFDFSIGTECKKTKAFNDFFGELMSYLFENNLIGTLIGVGVVYDAPSDADVAAELAEECKKQLSLSACVSVNALSAKAHAAALSVPEAEKVIYFGIADGGINGAVVHARSSLNIELGFIRCTDINELDIALSAVISFTAPDAVYCELGGHFEKKDLVIVDKNRACTLLRRGAAHCVREEYLFS